MLFNSVNFLIFLIIVFPLYFLCPKKYRFLVLLAASYYFYMSWNVKLVFLILFTTIVSYVAGILISKTNNEKLRKLYLALTLILCLGTLVVFKYSNFLVHVVLDFLHLVNVSTYDIIITILLPVGISFYTFQTLSYVIDVYRNKIEPEKNFLYFALYVSFFPQLVAGPIERPENLLPQLKNQNNTINVDNLKIGLKIMLVGFVKKIVIADMLGIYADKIFNNVYETNGALIALGAVLFSMQILCDFSGYSDIAIGTAKLFNIDLMKNFNKPYSALTIKDFWSRWHISLSSWFKDYLYIPLGGNRKGVARWALNVFIVFFVSGLWHGASYTFILWGVLHAIYQIIGRFTLPLRNKLLTLMHINVDGLFVRSIRKIFTFILVAFAFIAFRSNSVSEMLFAYKQLFTSYSSTSLTDLILFLDINNLDYILAFIGIVFIFNVIEYIGTLSFNNKFLNIGLKGVYVVLMWLIIVCFIYLQSSDVPSSFIYFQF